MKKVKATAGVEVIPEVTAAPAPPEPQTEQTIAPRFSRAECAAIVAAYEAVPTEALGAAVHKLHLFGYRP